MMYEPGPIMLLLYACFVVSGIGAFTAIFIYCFARLLGGKNHAN